ncbi:NAD(P)H-dependent oxidoreductase [Streptomyces sp. NPDC006733]|uniref:membrane protein YczE n=1 Tax=Streptomyces sp. NPDC006733 TaxID=3155460 RepID=UPI0033F4992A
MARLVKLLSGLVLFGISIALMVAADLGVPAWDVLHQGLSRWTGLSFGWVVNLVGALVLLAWIPLRVRPGIGTLCNILLVGMVADTALRVLPHIDGTTPRLGVLLAAIALNALATGLYIGADLGPGPRDGLMTGLAARGVSLRTARTAIEVAVLAAGWLLGGTVGIGTLVYSAVIGPLAQPAIRHFTRAAPALPQAAPPPPTVRPCHERASMMRLHIISCSTRTTSAGRPLARWIAELAAAQHAFEPTLIDLGEVALPFLDEPGLPSDGHYVHQQTKDWSALIDGADAFVFVMPMYNGGFTAPLKNAIDTLYREWQDKPVGLISYSTGSSGGAPAVEMIRPVLARVGLRPAAHTLSIPAIEDHLDEAGRLRATAGLADQVQAVLAGIARPAAVPPEREPAGA